MLRIIRRDHLSALLSGLLVTGALVAVGAPAEATPLTAWNRSSLKQQFANLHHTTLKQVEELHVYDLKRVRGVVGFTLGRHRSKNGKYSYGGVAIYTTCGKKICISSMALHTASKVRGLSLLDLSAKQTRIAPGRGSWFVSRRGRMEEPPRRARRPVLAVQSEVVHDGHQKQTVYLISLENPERPRELVRLTTLSTQKGAVPEKRHPKMRRGPRRFNGTRVTDLRFVKERGKPPRLEVMEKRISTRFNRCKEPKPVPIIYKFKEGRFVQQPRKDRPGGCR